MVVAGYLGSLGMRLQRVFGLSVAPIAASAVLAVLLAPLSLTALGEVIGLLVFGVLFEVLILIPLGRRFQSAHPSRRRGLIFLFGMVAWVVAVLAVVLIMGRTVFESVLFMAASVGLGVILVGVFTLVYGHRPHV